MINKQAIYVLMSLCLLWTEIGFGSDLGYRIQEFEKILISASDKKSQMGGADTLKYSLQTASYYEYMIEAKNYLFSIWEGHKSRVFAEYLLQLWHNSFKASDNLVFQEASFPYLKLDIALLIGQSQRGCLINTDMEGIRKYVKSYIDSKNPVIQSTAVLALGTVGNSNDIPLLVNVIRGEVNGIAEIAVSSLQSMGHIEAVTALRSISNTIQRESLRAQIDDTLSYYGPGFKGFLQPNCRK